MVRRFFALGLLLSLAFLLAPVGTARPEAAGADRPAGGGDYDYLATPAGGGALWCERQCDDDARCRAWTFVRASGQCRLKRLPIQGPAGECCISGVKAAAAAPTLRDTCASYANSAVADEEANRAGGCGYRGDGWSDDYKLHFRVCLDMSAAKRKSVGDARARALKRCGTQAKPGLSECGRFAMLTAAVDAAGRERDCRLDNAPWLGGYAKAYDWCTRHSGEADVQTLAAARGQLAACFARGGGPFQAACETYAQGAVTQFEAARKAECGFRADSRWNDSFAAHYQWCLKVDRFDTRNETEARQRQLDQCLADAGNGTAGKLACGHYARVASEQTRSNVDRNCGLKGRRWLADYDRQYAWCIATSKTMRQQELNYREDELDRCFQRGGGAFDEACDSYASAAAEQQRQSVANGCGFRGADWDDSYIRHYKWCQSAKPGEAQKRLTRRNRALETCRLGVRQPPVRR